VDRDFRADEPTSFGWLITYVPTWAGFFFSCSTHSARVWLGRAMASHLKTELLLDALEMALAQRNPDGVIHARITAASTHRLHSESGAEK
jgi:putative transposase